MHIELKRALVSVDTVKAILDRSEDFVLALIEAGKLRFAFNLSRRDCHRRLLRILSLSVHDYVTGRDSQPGNVGDAVRYALPGSSPEITSAWLARHLNTSHSHVHGLLREGSLHEVKVGARLKTHDRIIHRPSAINWLTQRRCC